MYICNECKENLHDIEDKSNKYSLFYMRGSSFRCEKCSKTCSEGFEVTIKASFLSTNSSVERKSNKHLIDRHSKSVAHPERTRVEESNNESISKSSVEKRKKSKTSNDGFKVTRRADSPDTDASIGRKDLIQQRNRIENMPEESKTISSAEKPHRCTECPSTFKHKFHLTAHKKKHDANNPYICKICGIRCVSKSSLEDHQISHNDSRNYQCSKCDKTFKYKSKLNTHAIIHDEKSSLICQICNRKCRFKSDLAQHMRVHSNVRPYKCSLCSSDFKRNSDLTRHMKKHNQRDN